MRDIRPGAALLKPRDRAARPARSTSGCRCSGARSALADDLEGTLCPLSRSSRWTSARAAASTACGGRWSRALPTLRYVVPVPDPLQLPRAVDAQRHLGGLGGRRVRQLVPHGAHRSSRTRCSHAPTAARPSCTSTRPRRRGRTASARPATSARRPASGSATRRAWNQGSTELTAPPPGTPRGPPMSLVRNPNHADADRPASPRHDRDRDHRHGRLSERCAAPAVGGRLRDQGGRHARRTSSARARRCVSPASRSARSRSSSADRGAPRS